MAVARTEQCPHPCPITQATDEVFAQADTSKVVWVSRSARTQVEEVLEVLGKFRRDEREGSPTFDWVVNPSTFDGRDSESFCVGGSARVKDDQTQ